MSASEATLFQLIGKALLEGVIVAIIGGIIAYFGLWPKVKAELKKEYESRINEQKWKAYSGFAGYMGQLRDVSKPYDPSHFTKVVSDLLLVAGDSVIQAYKDYISLKRDLDWEKGLSEEEKKKAGVSFVAILAEMRKDLGYESANVDDLSLLYSELGASPEQFNQIMKSLFFYHWLQQ